MGSRFLSEHQLAHFLNSESYVCEDSVLQESNISSEASIERLSPRYFSLRKARRLVEGYVQPSVILSSLQQALLWWNTARVVHQHLQGYWVPCLDLPNWGYQDHLCLLCFDLVEDMTYQTPWRVGITSHLAPIPNGFANSRSKV